MMRGKKPLYKVWEGALEGAILEYEDLTIFCRQAVKDLPVGCSKTFLSGFLNPEGTFDSMVISIGDGNYVYPLPTLAPALAPA